MNYSGSSRKLVGNAISAVLAAIEIYNKPRFPYRDEVVVVLLANAWELLLKALVSKSKQSIYYPKKRHETYRTLSLEDAARRAVSSTAWPSEISGDAVCKNIELITLYRNNVIHFYNEDDFGVLLYSLTQTAIYNFRDIASKVFNKDIADELSWRILPLGTRSPVDPVEYLKNSSQDPAIGGRSPAVRDYLSELKRIEAEIDASGGDTGRLLTLFSVKLESQKKISNADIVVGVSNEDDTDALIVHRKIDPNTSHPYRQKDIIEKLKPGKTMDGYTFLAITDTYGLRDDIRYCWTDSAVSLRRWSGDVVSLMRGLSEQDVSEALRKFGIKKGKAQAAANAEKRGGPPKPRPW